MTMVTIRFEGRVAGALGVLSEHVERRPVTFPSPFTYGEAKEAARLALYQPLPSCQSPAYQDVRVTSVAFN